MDDVRAVSARTETAGPQLAALQTEVERALTAYVALLNFLGEPLSEPLPGSDVAAVAPELQSTRQSEVSRCSSSFVVR